MWQGFLATITHLGDPVLLLLCGLAVFFYLWSGDERRGIARSWAVAFGICVLLTLAGKFVFHLIRWNEGNALRLLSPSGHVAIGTGFYGCCAIMLAAQYGRAVRALIWIGTALLLGMIAASRLALHSVPEIILAFAIGGASIGIFMLHPGNSRPIQLHSGQMVTLIILMAVAYYMPRVSGEKLILHLVRGLD